MESETKATSRMGDAEWRVYPGDKKTKIEIAGWQWHEYAEYECDNAELLELAKFIVRELEMRGA